MTNNCISFFYLCLLSSWYTPTYGPLPEWYTPNGTPLMVHPTSVRPPLYAPPDDDVSSPRAGALERISHIIREARIEQTHPHNSNNSHSHQYQSPSSSSLSIETYSSLGSSPTKSPHHHHSSPHKQLPTYGHKHMSSHASSSSQYSHPGPETSSYSPTHSSFSSSASLYGSPSYNMYIPTPMPNTFHSEGPPVAVPHLTAVHPSLSPAGALNNR